MQRIVTATGKAFNVEWCGPSTIDGALRFAITGANMANVITTFTNKAELGTVTHIFDDHSTVFYGYSVFKGVDLRPDNTIIVALMEERS